MKSCFIGILTLTVLFTGTFSMAQRIEKLTLEEVLHMARENSLDAFRTRNMYLASYWEYKSFKARLLPNADLQLSPFTYRRTVLKRYDSERNIEVYRPARTLDSYANLSISQNIPLTGGRIYIDSDLGRLQNFGEEDITTYSATPIRIGFEQPLLAFNPLKWQKKIAPLRFDKSRQAYIQDQQEINLKAVNLFFDLVLADLRWDMAKYDLATSDTLLSIGKKRFGIAAIDKENLLNLELRKVNAAIALTQATKDLERAQFNLSAFLSLDKQLLLTPVLPGIHNELKIELENAMAYAMKYNPEVIGFRQRDLESQRDLNRTIKENRMEMDLIASYGLNQQSAYLENVYQEPLNQQLVAVQMTIPILDWGERKGQRQMAERNREVAAIEIKQERINFRQQVSLKVMDFNLQEAVVKSSFRASELARESFELTKKRFLMGRSDIFELNASMSAMQSARVNYINSVYAYWSYYYEVQQLTLFNYMTDRPLTEDFEAIVND